MWTSDEQHARAASPDGQDAIPAISVVLVAAAVVLAASRNLVVSALEQRNAARQRRILLVELGMSVVSSGNGRRNFVIGGIAIVASAALLGAGPLFRDQARFLIWAPLHLGRPLAALPRDGIVTDWDAWGFAGLENDSFLVVDANDALGSMASQRDWTARVQARCGIAAAQRVWPRLYIVTTSDCVF